MSAHRAILGMLTTLLALASAFAEPDGPIASPEPDWPQWRGPSRDGVSAEKGLLQSWPEGGPKLRWTMDKLGTGWSSPIVVGSRIYITGDVEDDLVLYAFDLDGKLVWKTTNGKSWTGAYPGARACCAYSEGRLYHLNAHGRLVCLDPASGKELWNVDILERFAGKNITWAISECLLVDGNRLIVTPGGRKALMAALDKKTGETIWTTEPIESDKTSYCSPLLFRFGDRRLIASCSSAHGFGVDAETGKRLWTVPLKSPYGVNTSTPVFGSGRIFYVTAYAPAAQYRLVQEAGGVRAEPVWTNELDTVTGCAVLLDDVMYIAGYRKPKWWFAIDWKTGQTRGELKSLTTGAAIYADGRLYCLAEDGAAALLEPRPDGLVGKGRFQLVPGKVHDAWAHPVLLDGRLYLRYHDRLWCFGVKAD